MSSSYYCEICEKAFRFKSTFEKHAERKFPCRKALFICSCNKRLASKDSLRIHRRLYCKNRTSIHQPTSSIFDEILKTSPEPVLKSEHAAVVATAAAVTVKQEEHIPEIKPSAVEAESTLDEILKPIFESTPGKVPTKVESNVEATPSYLLGDLEGILTSWLNDVFQMESFYRLRKISRDEIDGSLFRLLQDGLINQQDYNDLSYTANLCYRLRELIMMPIPVLKRAEIIDILTELLLLKKINKEAYLIICNLIC